MTVMRDDSAHPVFVKIASLLAQQAVSELRIVINALIDFAKTAVIL